jgi:hypothetical protein
VQLTHGDAAAEQLLSKLAVLLQPGGVLVLQIQVGMTKHV